MKSPLFSKIMMVMLALLVAGSAFAADATHKGSLQISEPTQVNGKQLPAGVYDLKWEGSGPNVDVSIMQGKKLIATVPAQVVALTQAPRQNTTEISSGADGGRVLRAIRFSGKTYSLALGTETAKAQSSSSSTN